MGFRQLVGKITRGHASKVSRIIFFHRPSLVVNCPADFIYDRLPLEGHLLFNRLGRLIWQVQNDRPRNRLVQITCRHPSGEFLRRIIRHCIRRRLRVIRADRHHRVFNPHLNIRRGCPRKGYGLRNLFARNQFPTGRHRNQIAFRILVRIPVLERQGLPGLATQWVNW